MNILSQLTRQNIRQNRTRSLAAFGGIFLAAAMFTILTTAVFSLWDYVRRGTEYETGDYFVSADFVDEAGLEAAENDPLIRRITDMKITGCYSQFERIAPGSTYPVAAVDTAFFDDMAVPLKEGRLPENSSEIIIPYNINLVCLQMGWKTWEIGETIELDLFDLRSARVEERTDRQKDDLYRPEEGWKREYRIVGITDNKAYSDDENDWGNYCMLTLSDGAEGEILWHRLFLRTAPKDAAAVLAKHYGQKSFQNSDLLRVYGMGGIEQGTATMLVIILAALLIVAALSVVLIRSIFSVSVTERTREFGLLASIGTTPKQIRSLVRREAAFFLVTALPLGLLTGVLGAGGLLARYRGILMNQFTFGESVSLSIRLSPAALIAAALICTVTVLLSVASPARRASRIIPLEAIRQNQDIQIRTKKQHGSKRVSHLLGIPGWVGTRYERVAGKKYRAVTAALAFSLLLFLPAVFLAGLAEKQADAYVEDFDFSLYSADGSIDSAILEKLRAEPEISFSVLCSAEQYCSLFLTSDLPEEYKAVKTGWGKDYSSSYSCEELHVIYLEDSVFEAALKAEGIDPKPYLTGDAYSAVIVPFSVGGFSVPDDTGGWHTVAYAGYGPETYPEEMFCLTMGVPSELISVPREGMPIEASEYLSTDDGNLLLKRGNKTYLLEWKAESDRGTATVIYRSYDASTGEAGDAAAEAEKPFLLVHPLQFLKQAPDGCGNLQSISLLMPLSRQSEENSIVSLKIRVRNLSDYYSLLTKLKALVKENPLLVYTDHREDSVNELGIAALIRGIATGFLILISLLCGVNVFYTLSTNIVLRRRDFGILQSIGFTRKDLLRMVTAENTRSCARALLFGIPMGIGLCFILEKLTSRGVSSDFQPPWNALLLGAGVILLLMVLSTLYGLRLLKKTTPIEAIREENI